MARPSSRPGAPPGTQPGAGRPVPPAAPPGGPPGGPPGAAPGISPGATGAAASGAGPAAAPAYAPPRPGAAIAAIAGLCALVEGLLIAGDRGVLGLWTLRSTAYNYGAFWGGLLTDWTPNYAGQPAAMFLTYAWLHADIWHLAGNVMTLAYLAPVVAARAGTGGMVAIYLAAIPGGAAAFALLSASIAPMVGASGAVFGLAGAWQAHEWSRRRAAGAGVAPVLRTVAALVALNAALWWSMDGLLAWETHAGGFVAGWAVAAALERRRGGPPPGAGPEGRDAPAGRDGPAEPGTPAGPEGAAEGGAARGAGRPAEPPFRRAHLARRRAGGRDGWPDGPPEGPRDGREEGP